MSNEKRRLSRWLVTLVAILIVAVGVEGAFIYKLHEGAGKTAVTTSKSPKKLKLPEPWQEDIQPWTQGGSLQPFDDLKKMQQRMDHWFGNFMNKWGSEPDLKLGVDNAFFSPSVDLKDNKSEYVARMDIPGVDKSNIKVSIDDRVLTVSGTREKTTKEENKGKTLCMERQYGRFERSMTLPGPVDPNKMKASYKNGVLTVTIPKAAESETGPRTIPVK